jgi:hypothetical protein
MLRGTVAELDITLGEFAVAEERYLDAGKYLAAFGADVYVQGSFMLGTVCAALRARRRVRSRPCMPVERLQREHH